MSDVVQTAPVLDYERAESRPSMLRWLRSHAWGFFDQLLISGANFVAMWLAARAMGPDSVEFGQFTLIWSAMFFANLFQSALITQPHNVLGATREGEDYARYTSATGMAQLAMALAAAALALVGALVAYRMDASVAPMLLALAPTVAAWQIQEFVRRVLYTEGRLGAAFATDVIAYGGSTLLIVALFLGGQLDGPRALYAVAITALVAALAGAWLMQESLTWRVGLDAIGENWHFGKWIMGSEILGYFSSLHAYLYISAMILGVTASGELKAAQILFGPTRVFAFFLGTVLPIRFARTHHAGGNRALHAQLRQTFWVLAPLLGLYCLLIGVFGGPLLRLLFTREFAGGAAMLALFAVATFFSYVLMFVQAALTATRHTRMVFLGSILAGAVALGLSWPIIAWMNVNGAVVCMILTALISNAVSWIVYRTHIATHPELSEPLDEEALEPRQPINGAAPILQRVLETFDNNEVEYCLPHGYRDYAQRIDSDVDCLLPPEFVGVRLNRLLNANAPAIGADVVQQMRDASPLLVLGGAEPSGERTWLQLHTTGAFSLCNLNFYTARELLAARRRFGPFWVPAARHEFACTLLNRVTKRSLRQRHADTLAQLYQEDPPGCSAELERFWAPREAKLILSCIAQSDFETLRDELQRLRTALLIRGFLADPLPATLSAARSMIQRIVRFLRPRFGLHVVFLGPDGVGKSTVIDEVSRQLRPAFLRQSYQTFAALLPGKWQPKKSTPHELPPRSLPESLLKAAWWFVCYTFGYFFSVHLTRGRGGLVLCHRYLLDAIVDPKRYRYGGPMRLLDWIWRVAPKPDLIILLDAPPEVIQQRKQEVTFAETSRQRQAYHALIKDLPYAHVVDASQPLERTVVQANEIIVQCLRRRVPGAGPAEQRA